MKQIFKWLLTQTIIFFNRNTIIGNFNTKLNMERTRKISVLNKNTSLQINEYCIWIVAYLFRVLALFISKLFSDKK